jgi:hypothetical protein
MPWLQKLLLYHRGASLIRGVGLEACRNDLGEYKDSKLRNKGRATLYRPERQCKQSHMFTCNHMGPTGLPHMQLEQTKSHGARRAPSHVTGTGCNRLHPDFFNNIIIPSVRYNLLNLLPTESEGGWSARVFRVFEL